MNINTLFYTLLLFIIAPHFGLAQNVSRLTVNDGLPQSFVSGLVEDDNGFIWISTRNGLARYDGQVFKVYQHNEADPSSLSSNIITLIKRDNNNTLWVKYESGEHDRINMHTGRVDHIITKTLISKHHLGILQRGWCTSSDGLFWYLSFKKLYNFKISDAKNNFTRNEFSFDGDTIRSVFEDNHKQVWVLRQHGLSKYNAVTKKFINFKMPYSMRFNDKMSYGADTPEVHQRKNGELMWSDTQNLFFYNPATNSFRKETLPCKLNYGIKWIDTAPDGNDYFEANKIIYSYDSNNKLVAKANVSHNNFAGIQAFLVDKSGLVWMGINTDGIALIDLKAHFNAFPYKEDFALDVLRQEFGLYLNDHFERHGESKGILAPGYYIRSYYSKNKLWIALSDKVCYYDLLLKKIVTLPKITIPNTDFMPLKGITTTPSGEPLVINRDGDMFVFNSKTNTWGYFTTPSAVKKTYGYDIETNYLYADESRVWISTESEGLLYFDIKKNKIHKILKGTSPGALPTNELLGIVPDKTRSNLLWIGSRQGLICFNKNTMRSEVFSTEQGLPDNIIYSILPDKAGYLWLGTNKGLCRFNPVTHKQRTFTISYGLPGNEFNRFHQLALPNGTFAFGTTVGWILFDPLTITDDTFNPPAAITGIKINNVACALKTGDAVALNNLKKLELTYNENTLAIQYAGLQFSHPKDIKYRYRLEGYDTKWITWGNDKEAVYTKIPPGNYVFKVNASNTTGQWSTKVKSFAIKITPPWWATLFAKIMYAVAVILIAILFINYRIRRVVIKREAALKEKETLQLRELDAMKTRFFSNVTHELRTPLTLILGPAAQLKHTDAQADRDRLLSIIIKNADSLLNLTNQLLDIAKLEAHAMKPQIALADVVATIKSITGTFEEEALLKNNTIHFTGPDSANYLFPNEMLERIIFNLVSNALKFSLPDGSLSIQLLENAKGITLRVRDTGIGIPADSLPHIFERFYQDDLNHAKGTGIGLSLVKELTDLQGGTITVTSSVTVPSFTEFVVTLPYEKYICTDAIAQAEEEWTVDETTHMADTVDLELDIEKPLVLVVEDNRELADFIIENLSVHYNVKYASSGEQGVALALQIVPSIIVSDVLMQGIDGFEVCKQLKKNIITSHIPIILLTAKADMVSRLEGLTHGADDYITKPFNVPELLLRIKNNLQQLQRQREFLRNKLKVLPGRATQADIPLKQDPFLCKIQGFIEEHLDNDGYGVVEVATALGISRTSLHRKIKALTGLNTTELIRSYRLNKSIEMLHKNITISEVAYKTGFGSPAYFSKCFKEFYGVTPTEFLQKN